MRDTRTVTVRFEGTDALGDEFVFERRISATRGGDNPRFYGEQMEQAAQAVAHSIRIAVEATYGEVPS